MVLGACDCSLNFSKRFESSIKFLGKDIVVWATYSKLIFGVFKATILVVGRPISGWPAIYAIVNNFTNKNNNSRLFVLFVYQNVCRTVLTPTIGS